MPDEIVFSDVRQRETYNQPLLYNIRSIHQSIMNIIVTNPGERLFLPDFGVGLKRYLFQFPSVEVKDDIIDRVLSQIARWEPRVSVNTKLSRITFDEDEKTYYIYLVFNVPSLGIRGYSMTISAPLEL